MKNNDFASAKSTSFEQIPVVDISEIHTKDGFEKTAIELVHIARSIGFFLYKRSWDFTRINFASF